MPLLSLPEIPPGALQREFFVDDARLEVTSMDIPPHGAFFVAGCSNGMVLLFDLTESYPQRNGILLAQIRAKGMHTNLRLTVKISDDSRMCFAGVMKGSSEMIAIDLSTYLVDWSKMAALHAATANKSKKQQQAAFAAAAAEIPLEYLNHYIFETFTFSDAKLRGFGAAASLPYDFPLDEETPLSEEQGEKKSELTVSSIAKPPRKYLLACGMGIKNVHIWQLSIVDVAPPASAVTTSFTASPGGTVAKAKRDEWTCIYDVASNGMTITHLGFRNDGKELLTKSSNANIRVWDLTKYAEEPTTKPSYEDIPNSHDVKCLMERTLFTYGGTYEFAMVKVDKNTPKEANRNAFELPERPFQEEDEAALAAGLRRRRTMREVQDIIGTQDGAHVLILCTDGGVMYYRRQNGTQSEFSVRDGTDSPSMPREDLAGDFSASPVADRKQIKKTDEAKTNEEEPNDALLDDLGSLQELSSVQREQDHDQTWTLKRIGSTGHVVLLKAAQLMGKDDRSVGCVSVTLLSNVLNKESITLLNEASVSCWHPNGLFYQTRVVTPAVVVPQVISVPTEPISVEPTFSEAEFAVVEESSKEKAKKKKQSTPSVGSPSPAATSSSASTIPTPFTEPVVQSTPQAPGSATKEPKPSTVSVSTPSTTVAKKPPKIDSSKGVIAQSERPARAPKEKEVTVAGGSVTPIPRNHVQALFAEAAKGLKPTSLTAFNPGFGIAGVTDFSYKMLIPEDKEWPSISLGYIPRAKRSMMPDEPVFVSKKLCLDVSPRDKLRNEISDTVKSLVKNWHKSISSHPFPNDISLSSHRKVGANTLQVIGNMMKEQLRVRGLFVMEIEQELLKAVDSLVLIAQNKNDQLSIESDIKSALSFFTAICNKFKVISEEMVLRQNVELKGLFGREDLENVVTCFAHYNGFSLDGDDLNSKGPLVDKVFYRYEDVYRLTQQLEKDIHSVIMRA